MLTEKQTAFLKTWLDHQTWPVESEKGTNVDRDKVLFFLEQGIELRFQAPLDADGEPLREGVEYRTLENAVVIVNKINYDHTRVITDRTYFSFFNCPTLRKHKPEPKQEKWKPEIGETYYWFTGQDIDYSAWGGCITDQRRMSFGNVFETYAECEAWAKRKELGL